MPEPHRTFEQVLDYVIHRDTEKVRETPPPLSQWDLSPEVRKAIGYLWRALETGDARAFEPRDIYGIERLCAVPRSRWRVDPTQLIVEGVEATHGNFTSLIARIESCTAGVLISAADLVKTFEPTPAETANAPNPVAPKPKAAKKAKKPKAVKKPLPRLQRKVKAALLSLHPEGIGVRDTYDALRHQLKEAAKIDASRPTLVRVLREMPTGWRKKR